MKFITSVFLLCILVGIPINLITNSSYDASWTIGEWLVSYQGGFIRRGLSGSIIYFLTNQFNINPIFLIWTISITLYLLLFLLIFKYCKSEFPKYLIFSPIFLAAPIIQDVLIRKDNFLLLLFGLCLLTIERQLKNQISKMHTFFIVNVFSILAILNHESYGFWALPILVILVSITKDKYMKSLFLRIRSGLFFLLPSFITFFLCFIFKGNQDQANIIHLSWRKFYPMLPSPQDQIFLPEPIGTIGSLSWSLREGIDLSLSTLVQFSNFIWIPGAWIITILICALYFISSKNKGKLFKLKNFILFSNFLFFTPLFILGWDFGRWIFLWIISSCLMVSFIERNDLVDLSLHPFFSTFNSINKIFLNIPNINRYCSAPYFLLFFGVPGCCWSIASYIRAIPIGYLTLCNSLYCPLKNLI